MLDKISMLRKCNRAVVLIQYYKIKHVGNLLIYCYKAFFWREIFKETIMYMKCVFKDFFFSFGVRNKKKRIHLTIILSVIKQHKLSSHGVCWCWFKLSFVLSCGNKLRGQKCKDFELLLIQVVLSYIVFSKCCQLKRKALCLQICFEMFARILVVSLINMFVSSIQ